MRVLALALAFTSVVGCKSESPAGTLVADWTYASSDADPRPAPAPMHPPRSVTSEAEWPTAKGPVVKLRFETEIGDYRGADAVRWNWPRRVRITLAAPTRAPLPSVDCMPAPPGNKVENGKLVRPVGRDGVTPTGLVGCFFSDADGSNFVFDVNGDGEVTRVATKR